MSVRRCALDRGLQFLSDREVDLVVGPERPVAHPLAYHPVVSYDFVLITALDHALAGRASVSVEEAIRYPVVAPPLDCWAHGGEGLGARLLEGAHVVVEANDWAVVKRFVEDGVGVAVVPSLCLLPRDRLVRVALEGQTPSCGHGVYVRRDRSCATFARRFVDTLTAGCAPTP